MTKLENGKKVKVNVEIKYVNLKKIIKLEKQISQLKKELNLLV